MAYQIGDVVRVSATFENESETPTDPTTTTFILKDPAGTKTTYTKPSDVLLVKDDDGDFHVDVTPTMGGVYFYRFAGVGDVVAAGEGSFEVDESELV